MICEFGSAENKLAYLLLMQFQTIFWKLKLLENNAKLCFLTYFETMIWKLELLRDKLKTRTINGAF